MMEPSHGNVFEIMNSAGFTSTIMISFSKVKSTIFLKNDKPSPLEFDETTFKIEQVPIEK